MPAATLFCQPAASALSSQLRHKKQHVSQCAPRRTGQKILAHRSVTNMSSEVATLVYFKGWGRAEQCRWMLSATDTQFQHFGSRGGLETAAEFDKLKNDDKLLFGQVPVLLIDGINVVQSQAIIRHVARRAGRTGKAPAEQALADMAAEGASDFRRGLLFLPFGGSKQQCLELLDKYCPVFERMLSDAKRAGAAEPFVGGGADWTHGDVLVAEAVQGYCETLGEGWLGPYPLLAAHRKRIVALPGVVSYLKSPLRFPTPVGDVARVYAANVSTVLQ